MVVATVALYGASLWCSLRTISSESSSRSERPSEMYVAAATSRLLSQTMACGVAAFPSPVSEDVRRCSTASDPPHGSFRITETSAPDFEATSPPALTGSVISVSEKSEGHLENS
uniref:Uncharacterized protein n=1 Tax=Ixodes ricinus TaxID=34613 RepID=A0A6B0ULA2_IXORI